MKFVARVLEDLRRATNRRNEITGYLFYVRGLVMGYFITGEGSPGKVVDSEKRLRELENFYEKIKRSGAKICWPSPSIPIPRGQLRFTGNTTLLILPKETWKQ